jgi:hypothetical protein
MITFEQFCNSQTCKQRYAWFYLDKEYLSFLTDEEKSLIEIEQINDPVFVRIWFPKSKYVRPVKKKGLAGLIELMAEAQTKGDMVEFAKYQMVLKQIQEAIKS